jgi:tRNA A37 N6-isopentenylltransferase MiaA
MLSGHLPVADLERDIATATRQYAKRQVTWFKKIAADAVLSETSDVTELLSTFETLGFRGEE